jgi:hypothetical protein
MIDFNSKYVSTQDSSLEPNQSDGSRSWTLPVSGLEKLMSDLLDLRPLAWGRSQGLIQQLAQQFSQPRNPENPENPENYQLCIVFYNRLAIFSGISDFGETREIREIRKNVKNLLQNTIQNQYFPNFGMFRVLGLGELMSELLDLRPLAWGISQGLIQQLAQQFSQPRNLENPENPEN